MFGDSDDLLAISLNDRTQKYKVIIIKFQFFINKKNQSNIDVLPTLT